MMKIEKIKNFETYNYTGVKILPTNSYEGILFHVEISFNVSSCGGIEMKLYIISS